MVTTCVNENRMNINQDELQPADILLVHTRRSFWGWLIRFGTHCYWNHALMVYSAGESKRDHADTLVVDAKTDGSVVLRKLNDYLLRMDKYDIAVKRLKDERFYGRRLVELRNCICGIAINEVQTELALRLKRMINQFVRQFTVIWRFVRRKLRRAYIQPKLPWNVRPSQVKAFTCGGFVQWCYYMGVSKTKKEKNIDNNYDGDVVFNPRIAENPTPFGLLTTTPADLANCDKLSWVCVIKRGVKYINPDERYD